MIPTTTPQLVHANQYRAIRARCLPLLNLAAGRPAGVQSAIHTTIVCQIEHIIGGQS